MIGGDVWLVENVPPGSLVTQGAMRHRMTPYGSLALEEALSG